MHIGICLVPLLARKMWRIGYSFCKFLSRFNFAFLVFFELVRYLWWVCRIDLDISKMFSPPCPSTLPHRKFQALSLHCTIEKTTFLLETEFRRTPKTTFKRMIVSITPYQIFQIMPPSSSMDLTLGAFSGCLGNSPNLFLPPKPTRGYLTHCI